MLYKTVLFLFALLFGDIALASPPIPTPLNAYALRQNPPTIRFEWRSTRYDSWFEVHRRSGSSEYRWVDSVYNRSFYDDTSISANTNYEYRVCQVTGNSCWYYTTYSVKAIVLSSDTTPLKSTNGGPWGAWGKKHFCKTGEYATGFKLRNEAPIDGDDTAANSVKLYCNRYKALPVEQGFWGRWDNLRSCPRYEHIRGFRIKVEPKISGDDTAMNSIEMRCTDGTTINPSNGGPWGSFGRWQFCPNQKKVCGIRLKIEGRQGDGDDTALNDVELYCCD